MRNSALLLICSLSVIACKAKDDQKAEINPEGVAPKVAPVASPPAANRELAVPQSDEAGTKTPGTEATVEVFTLPRSKTRFLAEYTINASPASKIRYVEMEYDLSDVFVEDGELTVSLLERDELELHKDFTPTKYLDPMWEGAPERSKTSSYDLPNGGWTLLYTSEGKHHSQTQLGNVAIACSTPDEGVDTEEAAQLVATRCESIRSASTN